MGPLAGKYRIVAGALALRWPAPCRQPQGCAASQASASEDLMAGVEPAASPIDQASLDGPGARGVAIRRRPVPAERGRKRQRAGFPAFRPLRPGHDRERRRRGDARAWKRCWAPPSTDLNAYLHAYDQTLAANAAAAAAPIADLDDMDAAEGAEGGTDDAEGGTEGGDAATARSSWRTPSGSRTASTSDSRSSKRTPTITAPARSARPSTREPQATSTPG